MSINKIQQDIKHQLSKNYFTLFGLPITFTLDSTALKQAMLSLQKQYHPDNYQEDSTSNDTIEDVLILSSTINHAYQILLNPSSRAIYLLQLQGITIPEENQITQDPEMLMQQMELRQRIDQAFIDHNIAELDQIEQEINTQINKTEEQIVALFAKKQYDAVYDVLQLLLFCQKALTMIDYE